jgi:hypothetical protein
MAKPAMDADRVRVPRNNRGGPWLTMAKPAMDADRQC